MVGVARHRVRPVDARSVDRAVDVDLARAAGDGREDGRVEIAAAAGIEQLTDAVDRVDDDAGAEPRQRTPEVRLPTPRQPHDRSSEEREVDEPLRESLRP